MGFLGFGENKSYYTDYGRKVLNLLNKSYEQNKSQLQGASAGAKREALANQHIANLRAGTVGSPIGSARNTDIGYKYNAGLRNSLQGLLSNKLQQEGALQKDIELRKIQERQARDQANADIFSNLLSTAGNIASVPVGNWLSNVLGIKKEEKKSTTPIFTFSTAPANTIQKLPRTNIYQSAIPAASNASAPYLNKSVRYKTTY